ncbi:MAG: YceI family protein [Bacteroidota bacterium]
MTRITLLTLFAAVLSLAPLKAQFEGLVVFVDQNGSSVTQDFQENYMPRIDSLAKAQGLQVKVQQVANGAPADVKYTPSIFFQNFRGRSLYVGRYHYVDKLKTFIRTVKRLPQQKVDNEKHDVLVWKKGRATVYSPVKITDIKGDVPEGFDQEKFKQAALKALEKGASEYKLHSTFNAQREHRAMYMAFYPYRGTDGQLFISMEMYSQFNCIVPVFRRFDAPLEGTWRGYKKAFAQAGKEMEAEMLKQLASVEKGDGLLPVMPDAGKNWADLGLNLPEPPANAAATAVDPNMKLAQKWTVDGPVEAGVPLINFHFLAPVDYYAGEITEMEGRLELGPKASVANALGKFTVPMEALTMGDESLDHSVHNIIAIADHPKASFTFQKMNFVEQENLTFGMMTQFSVKGEMDFYGVKAPIDVAAQMEPVLNEAGEPRLQVYATFELRLKERYDIDGPDGPDPAKDTMKFYLNFLLKPATN